MKSQKWHMFFTWAEVVGLFLFIGGAFLFLQYNNVSSLCPARADFDPCHKFQIRSDAGIGFMALGLVGIATGFVLGWLQERRSRGG